MRYYPMAVRPPLSKARRPEMSIAHAALAYPAAASPGGSGPSQAVVQILFLAALFAIFYFLLIRPQQRQRRQREAMLNAVKRGDRGGTSGGVPGARGWGDEQPLGL